MLERLATRHALPCIAFELELNLITVRNSLGLLFGSLLLGLRGLTRLVGRLMTRRRVRRLLGLGDRRVQLALRLDREASLLVELDHGLVVLGDDVGEDLVDKLVQRTIVADGLERLRSQTRLTYGTLGRHLKVLVDAALADCHM